jgi:uncharacterized protein (TIRG00374 family)
MGLAILLVQLFIKALKWHILLSARGIKISIGKILQVDYASTFMSLFVPSSISLDIFRAYGLSREYVSKKHAASSIIVDRVLGLLALLTVACISVALFYDTIKVPTAAYISFSALALFILMILLFTSKSVDRYIAGKETFIQKSRLLKKLNGLRSSINEYTLYKKQLSRVFLLSVLMQLARIFVYYSAALSMNAHIDLEYFLALTPIVILFVVLPSYSLCRVCSRFGDGDFPGLTRRPDPCHKGSGNQEKASAHR